jgi:hypothetical protein
MDYTTIIATKPGTSPPKAEKRTDDSKIFQIDCTPLLNDNELIHGKVTVNSPVLVIKNAMPKLGKYVRFKAEGGPVDIPYSDYLISFIVNTSIGSELSIPISIRVYSV